MTLLWIMPLSSARMRKSFQENHEFLVNKEQSALVWSSGMLWTVDITSNTLNLVGERGRVSTRSLLSYSLVICQTGAVFSICQLLSVV